MGWLASFRMTVFAAIWTGSTVRNAGGAGPAGMRPKYFSMTGWRIGWLVAPDDLMRSIECLKQNLFISAPTLSQHAAIAAFDCAGELDRNSPNAHVPIEHEVQRCGRQRASRQLD